MFRTVLYLLLAVVLISLLRSVIGIVSKAMTSFLNTSADSQNPASPTGDTHQLGGDLHRDPVCGTYVAESTPHQRRLSGQTFYYCSESCREKHAVAAR